MTTTEKQQKRIDRADSRRAALLRKADEEAEKAHDYVKNTPMGQPVMPGRAGRWHVRAVEKSQAAMGRATEALEVARRVPVSAGVAITSDDPEAISALEEQLAAAEAEQARMKEVNKAYKANGGDLVALVNDGVLTRPEAIKISRKMGLCVVDRPFPGWKLTNNSASIRRIKGRLGDLRSQSAEESKTETGEGWEIEEDVEARRVRVRFERRLDKTEYKAVRSAGFVWSRTENAFQRLLNDAGRRAARSVVKEVIG